MSLGGNTPRIRQAGAIANRVLDWFGFVAIVSPWRTVYVKTAWLDHPGLMRHEIAHLAQMDRDGWLRFWVQCVWWYFVPGYRYSPYEIEAAACWVDPWHPLLDGWDVPRC